MKWAHFLHRDMSVLFEYFVQRSGVDYLSEVLDLPGFALTGRKIDHAEIYHDANEMANFKQKVQAKGQVYLEFLANTCEDLCSGLITFAKNSKNLTPSEAFDKYCELQTKLMTFIPLFPGVIEPIITERLDEIVQKYATTNVPAEKLARILQKPSKPYAIMQEEMERYKLGGIIQREYEMLKAFSKSNEAAKAALKYRTDIQEKIDAHVNRFGWVETRHFKGDVWSFDYMLDKLRDALNKDCSLEHANAIKKQRQQENEIEETYHKLGFLREDIHMTGLIRNFIYLRTQRKDSVSEAAYGIKWIFDEIAQSTGIDSADLVYLMPNEIKELIKTPRAVIKYQVEIEKRKKGFALITYDGLTRIFADEFISDGNLRVNEHDNIQKVLGTTTYPGEVDGLVRRILDKYELTSIQDGEIIVTPMTSPDYVVVMDKVKGIITDEGGVTCHAAQISREYRIPCLTGTGSATKIFKTNESVHLEATHGFAEKRNNNFTGTNKNS